MDPYVLKRPASQRRIALWIDGWQGKGMRVVTRLKGVNIVRAKLASGETRAFYYHRATGTRLPDDPASPAFLAAWKAAEDSMRPARPGTLATLIDQYRDSTKWQSLRESTRRVAIINLNAVTAKFGTLPLAALEDKRTRGLLLAWHEEIARAHPRAADAKLSALQAVLKWGFDRGMCPANPIATFERAYSSDRADKIWLPEHIMAMEKACGAELKLAMTLALYTGQRQGDLLRLTWKAFDGEAITLTQSKTRARVFIPCAAPLRQALVAIKRGSATTILTAPNGRPWTSDAFGKAWKAAFVASGITEDLHFHDLRGTAVTRLAEAGCTIPEIASITGHRPHSAERILSAYLAMTPDLARSAIARLDEHARNRTAK